MRLSLYPAGAAPAAPRAQRIVYELERGVARLGEASGDEASKLQVATCTPGGALVWELGADDVEPAGALISRSFHVDTSQEWIVRCDRVDFPVGGIAHRHVHPGPGIRYLLRGEIEIDTAGGSDVYRSGEAWFESGPEPVLARASTTEETSFVRVLVLPEEWAGKRTIRYVEPVDEAAPKQTATVLLEHPVVVS